MKKNFRFLAMAVVAMAAAVFTGCSSDDDFLTSYEESAIQSRAISSTNAIINFDNAPSNVMASDQYGNNLYTATAGGSQVTTGYLAQVGESKTYIQFPINYLQQEWVSGQPWEYEYWNGGFAISKYNNMTQADYENQCSVYSKGGHSGNNFAVAYGYSDSYNDPQATYDKCAKIYLTDATGYKVKNEGKPVVGTAKYGKFNSVWVCNTTYAYLVMKDGNAFTQGTLETQKGWFKVVFVALDAAGKPTGKKVEYYLANFDSNKITESGLTNKIRTGWNQVDLSGLGDSVCTVAINFEGSDSSAYGLNTPAYVAIDDIDVTVNE
ncbi:DUF4465 domain-containing protein [Phocaeicola massiliensis]|uniref:DUF4465 domain-containing protein n=1 Tax=Phocaeicola massiliensis TaxID=204516 RepID=UPI001920A76E|nr:DUF4465 domain-containing protein [Phocaeicola massiliensis]